MNTLAVSRCIKQLHSLAGHRDGERALKHLEALLKGQNLIDKGAEDCLVQLARASARRTKQQMGVADAGAGLDNFDLYEESPTRLPQLIRAAVLLVEHGVNPLLEDRLLTHRAHIQWSGAVIAAIIASEQAGQPLRTLLGETVLHRLAAECMDLFRQPDYSWPADWVNLGRSSDGATPLHLSWSLTEGGPYRALKAASPSNPIVWMSSEYLEGAIFTSLYLVEKGALWETVDEEGVSAWMRMLQAYDAGVGQWTPNVPGSEWIEPVIQHWSAARNAQRLHHTWPESQQPGKPMRM